MAELVDAPDSNPKDSQTPNSLVLFHWLTTLILSSANERAKFISYLKYNKIDARPMITPIHQAKHFKRLFKYKSFELKNSTFYSARGVHLPSSTSLSLKKIKFICKKINKYFEK